MRQRQTAGSARESFGEEFGVDGVLGLAGDSRDTGGSVALVESDAAALAAVRVHSVEPSTLRVYFSMWKSWQEFCDGRGYRAYPASYEQVAAWLFHRAVEQGVRYSTVVVGLAAIVWAHRSGDREFDRKHGVIVDMLRALRNMPDVYADAEQVKPLDDEALVAIRATACSPRRGRGGRMETPDMALKRGLMDTALVYTVSDAGLRRSEAAALVWSQVRSVEGFGEITLGKTKTNKQGGDIVVVRPVTMDALEQIRDGKSDEARVFGLSPQQIARRIDAAAMAAGLGAGYGGHSGRVGMAVRMTRNGAPVATIVKQGRWSNADMVLLYTRSESAKEKLRWL